MISTRLSAITCAAFLAAGALLTAVGNPDHEVSLTSAGELWADLFRDADNIGLQLSRVSAKEEIDLGKKLAAEILSQHGASSSWEPYVNSVGQRLVKNVARKDIPYEFHVLQSPMENAFALPGGQIFIFEGMLQQMKSEAELSAVLGHEIGHVDARHCIERYQYELQLRHLGLADFKILPEIAEALIHLNYRQYQELEADAEGFHLSTAAGYEPRAITALFTRVFSAKAPGNPQHPAPLDVLVRLSTSVLTDYLRSHPLTEERVRRLNAMQDKFRRNHPKDRVYRGIENFEQKLSRQQKELPHEFTTL